MSRPPLVLGLVGLLSSGFGGAWSPPANNPAVDAIFADLRSPGSPGCALGVYRGGKVIYARGYGLANLEENVPITPQTVFDVGSISKQFTAASILLLEQKGRLRLTDDVRKYIPELPEYSVGQPITIGQMLHHTSGLRDYVSLFLLAGIHVDNVSTDDDALAIITRQRGLNFSPGTEWKYTGSGYFLLSLIVKRITGKTLKDFAAENIFRPLRMDHSQYRNDHTSLIPHRALAYEPSENGAFALSVSYAEENGDGMVHTSVEDLQKWEENFYSALVGGPGLVREMQEPGSLNDGRRLNYAKGLFLRTYRGLPEAWHAGESSGYRAYLLRFPEQHFSVACLCNGPLFPSMRAHRVAQLYLKEPLQGGGPDFATAGPDTPSPVSLTVEQLRAWSGNYRNAKTDTIWQVTDRDGRLWLDFDGNRRQLRPLSATEFVPLRYVHEVRLEFEPAKKALPRRLIVNREGWPAATLEAVGVPPTLSAAEWAAYAGDYSSDELRATYRLRMRDGKLRMQDLVGADGIVHRGTIPPDDLHAVSADEFVLTGPPLFFHFTRDVSHNLTGFVLNGFSERGIVFRRS